MIKFTKTNTCDPRLLMLLALIMCPVCCIAIDELDRIKRTNEPTESEVHRLQREQHQREQQLIKQENSLRKRLIEAAGDEEVSLKQELVTVSAELDEIDRIKEAKAAPRRAKEAKAAAEKAAERRAMGYIDDPERKRTAEHVIYKAGLSCPEVRSLRAMGDKGYGPTLRAHCTNNVFFLITISPDRTRQSVRIMD